MSKPLILVFPLCCIFLRYWMNTFIPALAVWASSSGWMSLQVLTSRRCPCLADSFSATFPHFCLFILPPKTVIQTFKCLDYCNTRLDPAMKLVFLAHCFEHASFLYPPHHQFPSSLTVIFHSFPGHHLSFTVKTSVPAQQDRHPPSLPPLLICSVLLQALMCCLCWKKLVAGIQDASFSSLKPFWATSFTLTPVTSLGQLSTGKWLGRGEERTLLVVLTDTFGLLPYIYLFLYLSPNVKAYQLGFCGSRLLRAVVSSPKHSVNNNKDSKELS